MYICKYVLMRTSTYVCIHTCAYMCTCRLALCRACHAQPTRVVTLVFVSCSQEMALLIPDVSEQESNLPIYSGLPLYHYYTFHVDSNLRNMGLVLRNGLK